MEILREAAKKNDVSTINKCLQSGDFTDENLECTLILSAMYGSAESVEALLSSGIDVNCERMGDSAIHQACLMGHLNVLEVLLKYNANEDQLNSDYRTPLMYASKEGYTVIVRRLLNSGVNLDIKDDDGMTAAMLASMFDHDDIVDLFRQVGVSQFEYCDSDTESDEE
tara:strand:+ start:1389 stop:1892 length:504 start_codon:yes stop_codon:yes gene_type:complete